MRQEISLDCDLRLNQSHAYLRRQNIGEARQTRKKKTTMKNDESEGVSKQTNNISRERRVFDS